MSSPVTPQIPDYQGKIVTVFVDHTSTGTVNTVSLSTYHPLIDLDKAHPVISMAYIANEAASDVSDSVVYTPANEMARGTAPDSAGEWAVYSASSVKIYSPDKNGCLMITYYAKGGKVA